MVVLNNLIWMFLAYLIGSFNFSIILTSFSSTKTNIKEVGSGNAGATNAMRSYGFKFGLLIFILDTSKSFWFGFLLGILQSNNEAFQDIIPQACLIFVIIGHIFPLYFKFKGGKGAATLLGMIASISIILAAIGTIIFLLIVFVSKYVSLGSITTPYILSAVSFALPYFNYVDTVIHYGPFWVSPLCLFIGSIIVAISHWQNIIRLIDGTERKISFSLSNKAIKNKKDINQEMHISNNFLQKDEANNDQNSSLINQASKPDSFT